MAFIELAHLIEDVEIAIKQRGDEHDSTVFIEIKDAYLIFYILENRSYGNIRPYLFRIHVLDVLRSATTSSSRMSECLKNLVYFENARATFAKLLSRKGFKTQCKKNKKKM